MKEMDSITTIIITLITVLTSAGAWRFYEKKMKLQAETDKSDKKEQNLYRDDLRDRVKKLEKLLEESSIEKDEMRDQILSLTQEVSELRIKVTFLEKENDRLKNL
jgi:cytochrome c-type biogenesis protein CcmH/NrfG